MKPIRMLPLLALTAIAGCASNLKPPDIPEYHPASPHASEAPRIQAFDVLAVVHTPAPELPVPEGPQRAPQDPEMMGEKGHGKMPMQAPSGTVEHEQQKPPHGQMERPGMREGQPMGTPEGPFPRDHAPLQDGQHQHEIQDRIKRGEAPMEDKIVIPSEQRGMGADSTLYHEHQHHDSTHITHPDRRQDADISGLHVWLCPMHPQVAVATPGGRCPQCDTVLVPVKVVEE